MTNQQMLRLEVGTETAWTLSGPSADKYLLVNEYLGYLADRNYSPRTLRAYGYDLLAFCRWLENEAIDLESVTTETVLGFMRHCRQTPIPGRPANVLSITGQRLDHYSATTINHRLAALTGLLTFRTLREPDLRNPIPSGREARRVSAEERSGLLGHLVRPKRRSALRLREPRRLPRALNRHETADLLSSPRTWRDRSLAGLMLLSGLRSGELLTLDVTDIGARWIRVRGKGGKERRVPLDVEVAGLIQTYLLAERPESTSTRLFLVAKGPNRGKPLTPADLELDCIHEIPGQGSWLKVPLGKLDTERMIPLDEEVLFLVDRITTTRSPGRPMRHPRTGAPADFLFAHHGKRLSQNAVRAELNRAAESVGLGHITPHQLRHTYATALINAGVSLQALMALLGHVSAQMSLRYAHLFDSTVRAEYERALDLAKGQIGPLSLGRTMLPIVDTAGDGGGGWKDAPAIKSRLAGGNCLRAPAQGSCPYANICEHCPSFHTDSTHLGVLSSQRIDARALAADAESRGWIDEAERHHALIARLDVLISGADGA
ncbi:tyrosine-type recombinase/integrase [Rhodococcus erythropolis]|uniref:tyrosine-type recombinase/integrase n=1 Tax=Rhodococcus erythropolis TaxID=1833 RepID=UPI00294914C1|nr:tyrosine-type recombinase/integrase [Rhodococcus erythropolis]MDV6278639.1 tyrosine-type recombinase/integrase [Rhodococcus erythropolis]